jgi:hypothetical protein
MKNNLLAIGFLFLCAHYFSQTYSPGTNQTYTTCAGTFYDSGGTGANYADGQAYNVTFCSGNGKIFG